MFKRDWQLNHLKKVQLNQGEKSTDSDGAEGKFSEYTGEGGTKG